MGEAQVVGNAALAATASVSRSDLQPPQEAAELAEAAFGAAQPSPQMLPTKRGHREE
jgi:hypothetical protein